MSIIESVDITNPILLFDGYCNLCNSLVNFIIKNEKESNIYFASLQSDVGKKLLSKYNIDLEKTDSMVFIENNEAYIRSTAALKLSKHLKGLYPIAYTLYYIPSFIRDYIYKYAASNRYSWFGKSSTCMILEKGTKQRFL